MLVKLDEGYAVMCYERKKNLGAGLSFVDGKRIDNDFALIINDGKMSVTHIKSGMKVNDDEIKYLVRKTGYSVDMDCIKCIVHNAEKRILREPDKVKQGIDMFNKLMKDKKFV